MIVAVKLPNGCMGIKAVHGLVRNAWLLLVTPARVADITHISDSVSVGWTHLPSCSEGLNGRSDIGRFFTCRCMLHPCGGKVTLAVAQREGIEIKSNHEAIRVPPQFGGRDMSHDMMFIPQAS